MPKILHISKYYKLKDYFKVGFDNGETKLIDAETLVKYHLAENKFIDEEILAAITEQENYNRLKNYALFLLSKKSYSRKNLSDKLIQKGFEKENIEKLIERFSELNFINDESFARSFADSLRSRGKGILYIKNELKKHKIDNETIDEILKEPEDQTEEYERIIKVIKKKYPNFDNNDRDMQRKAAMFLQRRGFSYDDISKAFREYKNDN